MGRSRRRLGGYEYRQDLAEVIRREQQILDSLTVLSRSAANLETSKLLSELIAKVARNLDQLHGMRGYRYSGDREGGDDD